MDILFSRFYLCFTLSFLYFSQSAQIKVIPYQQLQGSTGMFFGANMSASTITVTFEGPSNRWIALGFGVSMTPADALVYSNGQASALHALGWNDYYCGNTSASNVTNDLQQDWTIISNNVAVGQRTVVASRALSTGDVNDAAISFSASALNIVWARSATPDYTLAYHGSTNRGNGISLSWLSQPVANFTTSTTTVCVGTPLTFSNTSTGGQTTYTWNFSGTSLSTSSATNVVVTYTAPGTYSVALTASNALGTSSISQLNYITVNPTVVPSVTISQSGGNNPICAGALATFTALTVNSGPAPTFQWKVNGVNSGGNSPTFTSTTLPGSASITLVMTSGSVCAVPLTATSSAINVTVNSSAPTAINIAITSGGNPICSGGLSSFSATAVNGGVAPGYQWKLNNNNVGTNSPTFTINTLSTGDVISCQINSSSTCAITTTALSNNITMTVSTVLIPSVGVSVISGTNPMCMGSSIVFTAQAFNGGNNPAYQWLVNGNNIGNNTSTFSLTTPANGVLINCILTSNSPCSSPNTATSPAITLTVNPIPPAPLITPNGTINLCSGKSLTLTSSVSSGNVWSNGANGQNIVVNTGGTYSVNQIQNSCVSLPSGIVTVSIIPSPTATLNPVIALCKNDSPVTLQGSPTGGIYSGTSVSGNTFIPQNTGTFQVTYLYTDPNTCTDTAEISVIVNDCLDTKTSELKEAAVFIHPNPTKGRFCVNNIPEKTDYLKIFNLHGQLIFELKLIGQENLELDLSGHTKGISILEIGLEKHSLFKKIVFIE